ncbi:ATP-binding protein [Streptomyces sp. NPDC006879]|uniref:sensor histidine kinase n=1 Tax=Streptomyces sp. NPDC006879 TaxID=3364767 RepID=UPI0036B262B7
MSELRAPAARQDRAPRREGGRRGRAAARPATHRTVPRIRAQLVRAAVLPALAAALAGAAAVIFTLQFTHARPDVQLWPVLAGCGALVLASLAAAALGAQRPARTVAEHCESLRRANARGQKELRWAVEQIERGEELPERRPAPVVAPTDEFGRLAHELRLAREGAFVALARAAAVPGPPVPAGPSENDQKVEVFVNLARRLQSLVHREITLLDDLEDVVEDPELLRELFHVDHLATRIRRHAENLAVLGGATSRRQWTRPIGISEVLRSSVAEVEQYSRVKVVPPDSVSIGGHAAADVIHLIAELVENATVFSAPNTDVLVRAERVTAGIAVEVDDRGLGMPAAEQARMNTLLCDPDQVSVAGLLADGRIGLYVVSALARRHGIAVQLKPNIYGGVLAVAVLPQSLMGPQEPAEATVPPQSPAPFASSAADPHPGVTAAQSSPAPVPPLDHRCPPPSPSPAARTTAGPAYAGERPPLPRRQGQHHLAAHLRAPTASSHCGEDEPPLHDPGLMAAFQRGFGLGQARLDIDDADHEANRYLDPGPD